jgi:PIN domain nuclease of toxin-antitoxin system
MTFILDASAMLALIFGERGAENVIPYAQGSQILAINFSEVVARVIAIDGNPRRAEISADRLEINIIPFDRTHASLTAEMLKKTSSIGASLADRACLAFAEQSGLPVLTADKDWSKLDLELDIRQIR